MQFLGFPIAEWATLLGIVGVVFGTIYKLIGRAVKKAKTEVTEFANSFIDNVVKPEMIDPIVSSMDALSERIETDEAFYNRKLAEHEKRLAEHDTQFYELGWRPSTTLKEVKSKYES